MGAEFSSLLGLPTAPTSPPQPAPPVTQAPPVLTTTPAAPAPPPATTAPRNTPPSLTPPPATNHTPTGGGTSSPPDPATTLPPDSNPPSSPLSTHAPSSRSQVSHPVSDPDTSAAVDDANLSQTSSGSSIPFSGPLNSLSAPDASVLLPITDSGSASASVVPPEGFSLSSDSGSDDLPAGTIAGIAVGCAAMLFLVGLASVCLRRRVRRQRLHNDSIRTLTPVEIYVDVEDSVTGSSIHTSSSESDAPLRAWAPRPGVLEPLRRSNRHLSGTPPTQDPTSPPTPANLSAETLYPATGSSEKSGYISDSSAATPSPPPPPPEIEPKPTQTQAQARIATIENAMRHLPSRERLRVTSLARLYMHRRAYDRELDVESSAGCGGGDVDSDGEERLPVYSRT